MCSITSCVEGPAFGIMYLQGKKKKLMRKKEAGVMTKKILMPMVKTILILGIIMAWLSIWGYFGSHYTREATVVRTDKNNEVIATDNMGNAWRLPSTGYSEGDKVELKMFTNNTDSIIYDDEVISVKIIK